MESEVLRAYIERNVSARTSLSVCGNRAISPRGTLIHTTSGTDSLQWLQGGSAAAGRPAAADGLIARSGTRYIIVGATRYAYHAGKSYFHWDRDYSGDEVSQILLGVELECLDAEEPTAEQIDSLAEYIVKQGQVWGWRWPYAILGHYAVARPLGRRSDPVNLDWGALMGRLYVRAHAAQVPGLV